MLITVAIYQMLYHNVNYKKNEKILEDDVKNEKIY